MKYIFNKWIPFKPYNAMCIGPLVFIRNDGKLTERTKNHEAIHGEQWKETLYIFFLPIYVCSFVWQFLKRWKWQEAYINVCMEREAYAHASDKEYLSHRKHFAWLRNS